MANKTPKKSMKLNHANSVSKETTSPAISDDKTTDDDDENKENNAIAIFDGKSVPVVYSDYEISDTPDGVGYRSPCVSLQPYQGSSSPSGPGRTLREVEDQLANLRKENFNLKLRLYFIEESIPGYKQSGPSSEDTLMKQLIDAKVEMEILRKEIQEKQDILKEAAQAMNQMETIQKETENKYQHIVEDLNQKIQYLEMERDLEKSRVSNGSVGDGGGNNGEFVNEILERSDVTENPSALQKIHEMEGLLKQSDEKLADLQRQVFSLEEILAERDETIKEYEEKVKELVFQNAELIETVENKENDIATKERFISGLRSKNADLRSENEKLSFAFRYTHDNFSKEMSHMQSYEKQLREQQDVLTKMQSTISIKTENTARLLERIQEYEKMVNKMNIERNIVKRENRFFRTIIHKLQSNSANNSEFYTFAKEEIYHKYENAKVESGGRNSKRFVATTAAAKHFKAAKAKRDYSGQHQQQHHQKQQQQQQQQQSQQTRETHAQQTASSTASTATGYKLKQKFCVNICNNGCGGTAHVPRACDSCSSCMQRELNADLNGIDFKTPTTPTSFGSMGDYLTSTCDLNLNFSGCNWQAEEIPIRYTISDSSVFDNNNDCNRKSSCSTVGDCCDAAGKSSEISLTPTITKTPLCGHNDIITSCMAIGHDFGETTDIFLKAQQLREEIQKLKADAADQTCMIQDLEEKLQVRDQLHDKARMTIQKLVVSLKNQQIENSQLRNSTQTSTVSSSINEKAEHTVSGITGLECTGLCRSFSDTEAFKDLTSLQKQKYDHIIAEQESTIKNLKAEVKKKTADLQNLVNKELWEKNREIERLNKILNKSVGGSPNSPSETTSGVELQQSFSEVDYNKAVQRNKLLQRKVDILIQRLDTERQNDAFIAQLKTELKQARLETETANKWRRQCADLCVTLSTRLEELAGFLNSLLRHKDVLGVLALDKRKAMRRAVDRSLDLSKSLNMTLSVSGLSMIDQSLAELHNLSDILGEVEANLENKTFNSHEDINGPSIEILKAENKALKKELDKRRSADFKKERRSLPLPMMTENKESESEAWSEPDRKVSLARIGLEDHSSSLMAKEQILSVKKSNETDSDYSETNSRSYKAHTQERISQLEQQIQQRDKRIIEMQCQLFEADNRLKAEDLKLLKVTQELQQVKQLNKELESDLIAIGGTEEPSNINEDHHNKSLLLKQIDEKSRSLEKLQEERDRLMVESRLAEMQINSMKADMEIVKKTCEETLQQAAEKEQQQLKLLKQEFDNKLQQALCEQEQKHQKYIQTEYIAKQLYNECCQQLNELQKQYIEAQRSIECLQENEQELKQNLVETELTARNLQKQIDESTLRASKAAMERVKALNEKLQVEKLVEKLSSELNVHKEERSQMQQKIEHLEKSHQKLFERMATLQTKQQSFASKNEDNQSGYTSEEVAIMSRQTNTSKTQAAQSVVSQQRLGEQQRIQNSSPDLGIESDGRVSSVELNNVQHPLLKTIEVNPNTKHSSRNNEMDNKEGLNDSSCSENIKPCVNVPEMNSVSPQTLSKKHDCLKVEQENAELRRKLLRTKRALEDTYEKLRNANQRKAQIEKDIKNQILKTHNVLKNVRSNMDEL